MIELPPQAGLFGRLYLPPTLIVSAGNWGARACSHFFASLSARYALRRSGTPDYPGPTCLTECFGRIALVRDIDQNAASWAAIRAVWPPAGTRRFTFDESLAALERWAVPRLDFEEHAASFSSGQVQLAIRSEWARIASFDHLEGCRALGIDVPEDVRLDANWVVLVASLWEPEVATIVCRWVDWLNRSHPDFGLSRHLVLLDAGRPDQPETERTTWANVPIELAAQFGEALTAVRMAYPTSILWFGSPNGRSASLPEDLRIAAAAGFLRAVFSSRFLDGRQAEEWRTEDRDHWNLIAMQNAPDPATVERASIGFEVVLDTSNVAALVAREVLSWWAQQNPASRSFSDVCDSVRSAMLAGKPASEIATEWLRTWFATGSAPMSRRTLAELRAWLTAEETRSATVLPGPAAIRPRLSWWRRALIWLRLMRRPTPPASPASTVGSEARVYFCSWLAGWARSAEELMERMEKKEGDFEPTRFDQHYDTEFFDDQTVLLRLRRLPLDHDRTPWISQRVEEGAQLLHRAAESWAGSDQPVLTGFVEHVKATIEAHVEACRKDLRDPNMRAQALGLAVWIQADPQLAELVADLIQRRLIPTWQALPGRHWPGKLSVFAFDAPTDPREVETTAQSAWSAIARRLHRNGKLWLRPEAELSPEHVAPANVVWVRSPAMDGMAFLWTEYQANQPGFRTAWREARNADAESWRKGSSAETRWIEFASSGEGASA